MNHDEFLLEILIESIFIINCLLIDYVTKKVYKRSDNFDVHRILNVSDICKGNGTVQFHFIFLFIRHHQI